MSKLFMITSENFREVILALNEDDKQRILKTQKEFVVLFLHISNAGSFTTCSLTNYFYRFRNVANHGDAILNSEEVIEIIKDDNLANRISNNIEENIAAKFQHLNGKTNRSGIFTHFRNKDESYLFPIFNRFNVTEKAIRQLYKYEKASGEYLIGLDLCYFLNSEISNIVNS